MADLSGRCLCGAVTWTYSGPILWAGHCHCESCRRATAAAFTSFFGAQRANVNLNGPLTDQFSSEGKVKRQFCTTCGTHMTYQNAKWPSETHLYAASLDDPTQFQPQAHFHWQERLTWVALDDNLPRFSASADNAAPL